MPVSVYIILYELWSKHLCTIHESSVIIHVYKKTQTDSQNNNVHLEFYNV